MPAVAWPREQPGERRQATGDAGADDRGLPPDREHVAGDRRERSHLGRQPWNPEQPRKAQHTESQEGDVLTRDCEQVIEPGVLEVVAELVREPLVLAEHDPGQHRTPLPFEPRGDRTRNMRAEAVREPADPTAAADDPPVAAAEDDVDAAACEPAALVEAVFRTARGGNRGPQSEDGALRRRASERKLEQDPLADRDCTEAAHFGRHPQREPCLANGTGDDDGDVAAAPDVGRQHAALECLEARAPPHPAGESDRDGAGRQACARERDRDRRSDCDEHDQERGRLDAVRRRQPHARSEHEQCRPGAFDHGVVRSRSCSMRAGPIPGIASRSSTERKPPCAAR